MAGGEVTTRTRITRIDPDMSVGQGMRAIDMTAANTPVLHQAAALRTVDGASPFPSRPWVLLVWERRRPRLPDTAIIAVVVPMVTMADHTRTLPRALAAETATVATRASSALLRLLGPH